MTRKVFVSYSHKDECFREALGEHLSMLKMNGVIEDWHDRKIVPGQKWSEEISNNLQQSEIILFLVSSSFMASGYCMEVEAQKALEMHRGNQAKLIPIVIRACDWADHDLAGFQGLPKDAKPVASWKNEDEAWLDVINGLKRHIQEFKPEARKSFANVGGDSYLTVNGNTLSWIDDTEVVLTHRKVNKVKLSDIYVPVDLEVEKDADSADIAVSSSSRLYKRKGMYLVVGEEQQGKTSLLKVAYKNLVIEGKLAIYVDAREVKKSDLESLLERKIGEQYENLSEGVDYELSDKVLLLDNLDEIGLNQKYRSIFLESVNEKFEHVIATCHSSFSFVTAEISELDDYLSFDMLGLGHQRRAELVEKWISLGVEESIGDVELYSQCDDLKGRLDTVIRKNIVPPKPIYVLMLLQMFEAYAQQNLDLTSHGHCYQQLVYKSFDQAKIPSSEIGKSEFR